MGNRQGADDVQDMRVLSRYIAQTAAWLAILIATFIVLRAVASTAGQWPARAPVSGMSATEVFRAAYGAAFLATALAAAPFIRFLVWGWESRHDEILNRLNNNALYAYLLQFWEQRTQDMLGGRICRRSLRPGDRARALGLFNRIYDEQYGRAAFIAPILLVLAIVSIETVLIVFRAEGHVVVPLDIGPPLTGHSTSSVLQAFGAMAGTYMFVVGDCVMAVRRRSLNISDVYWYALRLLLAVPIGLAVFNVGGDMMGAFVLGTLPVDQFRKLLSRYAGANFNDLESKTQASDQLLQLEGVTGDIAAQLGLEGIGSIGQLLGTDPVSLAIRTGLPFKFILCLGSQAVVRKHLGMAAGVLVEIGLGEAESIASLYHDRETPTPPTILATAVKRMQTLTLPVEIDNATLDAAFKAIAAETYTVFLLANASLPIVSTAFAKSCAIPACDGCGTCKQWAAAASA